MLAKIFTTTVWPTPADLVTDLKYILTGGTDKNQLHACVDKNTTEIFTGVHTSTWQLHHNVNSTTFVLKNAVSDNPGQYVYLKISCNPSYLIDLTLYETWNAGTGTGTFATQPVRVGQFDYTGQNAKIISVTSKSICFFNALFGSVSLGKQSYAVISERSRLTAWDTPANGYIPYFIHGNDSATPSTTIIQGLRIRYNGGADVPDTPNGRRNLRNFNLVYNIVGENQTVTSQGFCDNMQNHCPASNIYMYGNSSSLPPNANGKKTDFLIPLGVAGGYYGTYPENTSAFMGGYYSQNADLWATTPYKVCAFGDELVSNDATYFLIPTGASGYAIYALRKG